MTSDRQKESLWISTNESNYDGAFEIISKGCEVVVGPMEQEFVAQITMSQLGLLAKMLVLAAIPLVAFLIIKEGMRRKRLAAAEQRRREEIRSQRAACLENLKCSDIHISDAFDAREKGTLLKIMSLLEDKDDTPTFECAICYETCTVLAPAHSHGQTCLDCQRRSADLAVESGRFPECPICRERLSLKDLASIGASDGTQAYVKNKVRMSVHAELFDMVQSMQMALNETEKSDLAQLLSAFSPAAGSEKANGRSNSLSLPEPHCT